MDKKAKVLSQPTLTEFFLASAGMRYGKTAYITKSPKGQYNVKTTYGEMLDRAHKFASALIGAGISVGDIVANMSNPSLTFAIADIGTTMLGAVTGGIYVTDTPELLEYKLNHLEAEVLVIENAVIKGAPQLDKLLSIPRENLPRLKQVIVVGDFDPAADDRLVSFDEFADNTENMGKVSDMIYGLEPSMPAVIIYSSGTQGWPKGAILTHHSIMSSIRQAETRMTMDEGMRYLDFLPPAHVFGYAVRRTLEGMGSTIYVSHRDTLQDDLPMVAPHIIAAVPKFFLAMADRIRARVAAMSLDIENLEEFQKELILRAAGLFDCEIVISAAAAIPDETVVFFRDKIGLRIDQGYGATETSPGVSSNTLDDWKLGTVGKPFIGVDVAILDTDLKKLPTGTEGEIAIHGDNVFAGYYKDKERTDASIMKIDGEKWYLTGDIGFMDDEGYLTLTDRKDDMLVPISGENVSSTSVENKVVLASKYAGFCVPYGTARETITAVIWTDETKYDVILEDMKAAGAEVKDATEALTHPKFFELLESDLRSVVKNGGFNSHERPRAFLFLLNPTEEEVTSTLKARKKGVRKKFATQLDELYRSKEFLKIVKQ